MKKGSVLTIKATSPRQKKEYEKIAEFFKIMANAKRVEILDAIKDREITVNELSKILGTRKSNTSQHLALLRYTGLIVARHNGKNVFYKTVDPRIIEVFTIFKGLNKKSI